MASGKLFQTIVNGMHEAWEGKRIMFPVSNVKAAQHCFDLAIMIAEDLERELGKPKSGGDFFITERNSHV